MIKKLRQLSACTSTPTNTASASGVDMTSYWSPWSPVDAAAVSGGHAVFADVMSSGGVTSSTVNSRRQHSALWSPYLDLTVGEILYTDLFFHQF